MDILGEAGKGLMMGSCTMISGGASHPVNWLLGMGRMEGSDVARK
jgi:hypothetical protein